ncbi:hypothetical protein LOC67_12770 [Stieleria sp. JC731]|uniref:hypothetical protein n=1 Tax=Pirellulaceae TaxID=2691357 RepID=UPI001E42F30C|nr:hypothetical protein [Stieleria sp. JC731]MCC9601421.1 hypothetical protein [Stieleria sp. JC731]
MVLDYFRPINFLSEQEPFLVDGRAIGIDVNTIFLTGRRCPIGCNMCDLHRFTRDDSPPDGAITNQIDYALGLLSNSQWIKLYNSGNFFDTRSIPVGEYTAIAERCVGLERVIVENHPKIGRSRHREFAEMIDAKLEVAVGLETVHPRLLAAIGKQMTRGDFDQYAKWLGDNGIDLRVFLIVGAPGMSPDESVRWAMLSTRHAVRQGARHISLIPARRGAGWGNATGSVPVFSVTDLCEIFNNALNVSNHATVSIDLWEIAQQELHLEDRNRLRCLEEAILKQEAVMHEAV